MSPNLRPWPVCSTMVLAASKIISASGLAYFGGVILVSKSNYSPPKVEVVAREPGILRRFFDAFMRPARETSIGRSLALWPVGRAEL
jgi:hypothetical protein